MSAAFLAITAAMAVFMAAIGLYNFFDVIDSYMDWSSNYTYLMLTWSVLSVYFGYVYTAACLCILHDKYEDK